MINIEKLDNLPQREAISQKRGWWMYKYRNEGVWEIARRVINANIGKSYDQAYSIFCKKLKPWQDRNYFKDEFVPRRYYYRISYYVDDNGLIQKIIHNKTKKPIYIYSNDYKSILVHKDSGIPKEHFEEIIEKINRYSSKHLGYVYNKKYKVNEKYTWLHKCKLLPQWQHIYATDKDFVEKIISGSKLEVTSYKDHRYIRCHEDRRKQKYAISAKEWRIKSQENIENSKLLMLEKKRKDKEANDLKIQQAGFDLKTSFRN